MEKKPPQLTIRPQFSPLLAAMESIVVALTGTFAITLVGGVLLLAFISAIGLGRFISGGSIFTVLFVLGLAALPPLYYEVKAKAYKRTVYNFYDDYVEFQHFQYLINRRVGRISYREITNVTEHANFVQERERLTSIYLYAPSIAHTPNSGFSGLKLADVSVKSGFTGKILNLLDTSKKSAAVKA